MVPTLLDSGIITESDVKEKENELRPTYMNETVPEHVSTDMIASDREEGGRQSTGGEVVGGKSELLAVNCSVAVQKIDEGSRTDI